MDTTGPSLQRMPPEVVACIFRNLTEKDRLSAGATCQKLREVSRMSEFWRNLEFECTIGERATEPEVFSQENNRITGNVMESLGVNLHNVHLTIEVDELDHRITVGQILKQTKIITSKINDLYKTKHLRLQSFNWTGSWGPSPLDFNPKSASLKREDIMDELLSMLVLHELSDVGFDGCHLAQVEGSDFVLALATQINTNEITNLTIHNVFPAFNERLEDIDLVTKFSDAMGRFTSLERVALNHNYLSNNVLEKLLNASSSLNAILLHIDENLNDTLPSRLPDWQLALEKRPQLRVGLEIESSKGCYDYVCTIRRSMPLVSLSLSGMDDKWIEKAIARLILNETTHVCHNRLKVFVLSLENPWNRSRLWGRPKALVALLKACPSLTDISLPMRLTDETLLKMVDAVHPGAKEGEGDGSSALHSTSSTHSLKIHMGGCDSDLSGKVLEKLHAECCVNICKGCECKFDFI